MGSIGLKLADHKTEAVLFTSRKRVENITLTYLKVILDTRLSFKPHVEHATVKAAKVATAFARLMPNIDGSREPRRKLLV